MTNVLDPVTTKPKPVRARDAASLILLRGKGRDLELLAGRRPLSVRFMPGVYVFPGGAVDRVLLLQYGDDPEIEPGDLWVRVIPASAGPEDRERALEAFIDVHGPAVDGFVSYLAVVPIAVVTLAIALGVTGRPQG